MAETDYAALLAQIQQQSAGDRMQNFAQALAAFSQAAAKAGATTVGAPNPNTLGGALGVFGGALSEGRQNALKQKALALQTLSLAQGVQKEERSKEQELLGKDLLFGTDGKPGMLTSFDPETQALLKTIPLSKAVDFALKQKFPGNKDIKVHILKDKDGKLGKYAFSGTKMLERLGDAPDQFANTGRLLQNNGETDIKLPWNGNIIKPGETFPAYEQSPGVREALAGMKNVGPAPTKQITGKPEDFDKKLNAVEAKAMGDARKQIGAYRGVVLSTSRAMKALEKSGGDILSISGAIETVGASLKEQATSIASKFMDTPTDNLASKEVQSRFDWTFPNAPKTARQRANMLSLAIMSAKALNPGDSKLSDFDVKSKLKAIGESTGDPAQAKASLMENLQDIEDFIVGNIDLTIPENLRGKDKNLTAEAMRDFRRKHITDDMLNFGRSGGRPQQTTQPTGVGTGVIIRRRAVGQP